MKSDLTEGFALPFVVALIAIFTIIFGSILTTTSFYIKQKQISIERMQLNLLSMMGLSKFYHSSACIELEGADYTNDLCGDGFKRIQNSSESDESLFYQCHKDENGVVIKIDSCAVSKKFSMIVKYSINLNESNIISFKSMD